MADPPAPPLARDDDTVASDGACDAAIIHAGADLRGESPTPYRGPAAEHHGVVGPNRRRALERGRFSDAVHYPSEPLVGASDDGGARHLGSSHRACAKREGSAGGWNVCGIRR